MSMRIQWRDVQRGMGPGFEWQHASGGAVECRGYEKYMSFDQYGKNLGTSKTQEAAQQIVESNAEATGTHRWLYPNGWATS